MNKSLYIVAGANGSGKTTFSKSLKKRLGINFINADEIAKDQDPNNTTGGELKAGREFFRQIQHEIQNKNSFIIESTLSGKYLLRLIEQVKVNGYSVEIIYIFLENPTVCIERIKERVLNGGHHVPDPAVIRRFYRSKTNFWQLYKTLANKWFLIYNSDLTFKEFCIGSFENHKINDIDKFNEFIKDVNHEK
ncbi:MAG: zeta toxin family protein [Lentisphaeraceae bacterium]|nr:zeta toxin family protein [Lentisphaeraceae bacterium]